MYKFQENLYYEKIITVKFSIIWLGGPRSQGGPCTRESLGESIEGAEVYQTLKRSQLYLAPNSIYKGSKFDLLRPLAAKL